ncbi:MAG: hypothetical protein K2J66_09360 [Muribaculaceae bacterium]|nr:hypothetical protein [Muribaculaceae bacterium]
MDNYRHRVMDGLLEKKMQAKGAVVIEGPKWCGKTTTAEEFLHTHCYDWLVLQPHRPLID